VLSKFPGIKNIGKNLQKETLTCKFAADLETWKNTYSELVGLLRTRDNEQGINVREEAFYKINVQMLLSDVSLCFHVNVYLLQVSKIAFLLSPTSMLLRSHRAFSAKVRAKLQKPCTSICW